MKIVMSLRYWLLIVWLSGKWMFRINLSDHVWATGGSVSSVRKCLVCNGVSSGSLDVEDVKTRERFSAAYADCRKVWTLANILGSFKFGYRFYMNCWFDIWKQQGIKRWMRGCNIW